MVATIGFASGMYMDIRFLHGPPPSIKHASSSSDGRFLKKFSQRNGGTRGYKQQFACLGCPANTSNGCGLLTHYEDSGHAGSYDLNNGNRMPSWEKKGYGPDDTVSDWNM